MPRILQYSSIATFSLKRIAIGNFLFSLQDGTPVVWHDGIGVGQRAIFFLLPESGGGLIILTNSGRGNVIFREIVCAWDSWLHAEQTRLCQRY